MRIAQYFLTILVYLSLNVLIKGFLTKKGVRGEQRGGTKTETVSCICSQSTFFLKHGSNIKRLATKNVDWLMKSLTSKCRRDMHSGMFNIACMRLVLLLARWPKQIHPAEDEGVDYAWDADQNALLGTREKCFKETKL